MNEYFKRYAEAALGSFFVITVSKAIRGKGPAEKSINRTIEKVMKVLQYFLRDDGCFPNSPLPVLLYKRAIKLPFLFKGYMVKRLFHKHHWTNNWKNGVYTCHHYHSNTHEVMAVIKGKTKLQLGGENGTTVTLEKGDVILIPAGVAHKNLQQEKDVICIGGYPRGKDYDMNYGKKEERPAADERISKVPIPSFDPVTGKKDPMNKIWNKYVEEIFSK